MELVDEARHHVSEAISLLTDYLGGDIDNEIMNDMIDSLESLNSAFNTYKYDDDARENLEQIGRIRLESE